MKKKKYAHLLLLLPFAAIMLLVLAAAATVIMQSLGYVPAFGLETLSLSYYFSILQDEGFLSSLAVSLRIAFISALLAALMGTLLCAAIISRRERSASALMLARIPILVPHTIVAIFMITIFSQTGIVSRLLFALGLIDDYPDFPQLLFTGSYAGVIAAYLWKEIPFIAYFCFALMAGISSSLGEAAQNLGASPVRSFFQITLPLSLPAILNSFFIVFIFAFGAYELPMLLGSTLPKALPVEAYISFANPDLRQRPYSMAMNGVLLLVSLFFAIIYLLCTRRLVRKLGGKR